MIRLGPAGAGGKGYERGLDIVHELGLNAMEVEFVYGVRMTALQAEAIGRKAGNLNIKLSVHAPYYINLASKEKDKVNASKKRILDSCEKASLLRAENVVLHAGFYQDRSREDTYKIIKREIEDIIATIKKNGWKVLPALETTGKKTQFGDINEILKLREETGCEICVDFAHILAREGNIDYDDVFDKVKNIKRLHSHFSGIEYTGKGERRHIITAEKMLKPLIRKIIEANADITIINESPDPIGDSLKAKNILRNLS